MTSRRNKKRPWLRWALLTLALLTLYFFVAGQPSLFKLADMRRELRGTSNVDSIAARKKELLEEKRRLLTDSIYLEKLARQELGMAKPREKVYRFISTAPESSSN